MMLRRAPGGKWHVPVYYRNSRHAPMRLRTMCTRVDLPVNAERAERDNTDPANRCLRCMPDGVSPRRYERQPF